MGHTNYWRQQRDFTTKEWQLLITEAERVRLAAIKQGILLAGGDGTDQPIINKKEICLNGKAPDDCETFVLNRKKPEARRPGGHFDFCKTYQRPYDAVVVHLLHYATIIAPGSLEISSDGGAEVFKAMF